MNGNEILANPYNDDKVLASCALFGCMDLHRNLFSGNNVIKAMANMHVRGNGLGGGFAVYGLYPEYKNHYVFHIMYQRRDIKPEIYPFLVKHFNVAKDEEIPTNPSKAIHDPPLLWRYFLTPKTKPQFSDEYVVEKVNALNTDFEGVYVFSSGKDMGVFKGVGYPEDIAKYFCLNEYKGYIWTAHSRFPTNTQGWWGGAHPFNILDWTVVHNGEISSYGINRRFLETQGYRCTLHTDTEVIAYAIDLLMRKHKLPLEVACKVFAPPFWSHVDKMSDVEQKWINAIRQTYSSLLLNGPFTIIMAHHGEMIGLTDRIRLRPLTAGIQDNKLYMSSEESSIRLISPNLEKVWTPQGGEPIVGRLNQKVTTHSSDIIFAKVKT